MMVNELLSVAGRTSLYHQVDLRDDSLYCIQANFGTAIVASMFGAEIRVAGNEMPWVLPLDQRAIERVTDGPTPDPSSGLGQRAVDQIDFYQAVLSEYPRCQAAIGVELPDLQGPHSTAELLWGSGMYLALYDNAELVRALLSKVTEAMAAAHRLFSERIDQHIGSDWHYDMDTVERGNLVVKNDSVINISPRMFSEIVQASDAHLADAVGGATIHFCGDGEHQIDNFLAIPNLTGLDFGQAEMMDIDRIYAKAAKRRIPVVRAAVPEPQLTVEGVRRRFPVGAVMFYRAASVEKAHRVWNRYRSIT